MNKKKVDRRIVYTKAMRKYVRDNYEYKSDPEIARNLSEIFGRNFNRQCIGKIRREMGLDKRSSD